MGIRSSGCDAVDAMRNINFSGNIVPMSWYKKILRENGKPDHFAVTLLSDIVYWYRPTEVRDPVSGYVVSLQKKFDGDLLQKSYDQYANQYGESKRTVKAALDRLEELGLIKKVFRDLKISSTLIPNIMYIQIFPEKIDEITMEVVDDETSGPMVQKSENEDINNECNENENEEESSVYADSVGGHTKFCTTSYKTLYDLPQNNVPPLTKECRDILQNDVGGLTPDCETYTKNTTEITIENNSYPSISLHTPDGNAPVQENKDIDVSDDNDPVVRKRKWTAIIKRHISYDELIKRRPGDIARIDEFVRIMVQVVCFGNDVYNIKGCRIPAKLVAGQFLMLNMYHIIHVLESFESTNVEMTAPDNYIIASLYSSYNTYENEVAQSLNCLLHDNGMKE
jgi:hypothetical protein